MRRTDLWGNVIPLLAGLSLFAGLCVAQPVRRVPQQTPPASAPPQRTMDAGAAGVQATSDAGSDEAASGNRSGSPAAPNITAAMERYRQMWQKMTPAQQKVFIQNGGRTPEDYERMMRGSASQFAPGRAGSLQNTAPVRATDPRDAAKALNPSDLDSISKSLQDLNAIRDGNLGRVQKDRCPPEIAARNAELKSRMQNDELELNGGKPSTSLPSASSAKKSGQADPLAVAGDWFKRPPEQKSTAADPGNGNVRAGSLLDDVLPGAENASAAPKPESAPNSPEAVQRRNALLEDIARIKTELAQLSGACGGNGQ